MAKEINKSAPSADGLLPTPIVGMPVLWYERGDRSNGGKAAIVTAVEMPGRVSVTVFAQQSEPRYYKGVMPVDVAAKTPHAANTVRCGGWEFVDGIVPSDPYKYARAEREKAEKAELERMERDEARLRQPQEVAN